MELETPANSDELYRYRGDEVPRYRPIVQGDVFGHVEIPGLDDGMGYAVVLAHPCSMRDGTRIRERLLVGRVSPCPQPLLWTGHFGLMPLPDLLPGSSDRHWAGDFERIGMVRSGRLELSQRIACLDDRGILLLQQRQAHHFTRYAVETEVLYAQSAGVLTEVELLESWLEAALEKIGEESWQAECDKETASFDDYFGPLRSQVRDESRRASVRRQVNSEIRRRFS